MIGSTVDLFTSATQRQVLCYDVTVAMASLFSSLVPDVSSIYWLSHPITVALGLSLTLSSHWLHGYKFPLFLIAFGFELHLSHLLQSPVAVVPTPIVTAL
jgi:hypothetical protein